MGIRKRMQAGHLEPELIGVVISQQAFNFLPPMFIWNRFWANV